jgi:hypothetical protein
MRVGAHGRKNRQNESWSTLARQNMERPTGSGQFKTSVRLNCPCPRRREPGRCVPMAAIPSSATCSAQPTVGGAKSAALGDRHGNLDDVRSIRTTNSLGRRRLSSYPLPRRKPPCGISPAPVFVDYRFPMEALHNPALPRQCRGSPATILAAGDPRSRSGKSRCRDPERRSKPS